jgi:carbamoyl-phosphate synthase large subunit
VDEVLDACRFHSVRLLVPVTDYDLAALAEAREAIEAAGTTAVVCDPETVAIGRDKRRTADFLARLGIRTPRLLPEDAVRSGREALPVFMKPYDGSGSAGARRIDNLEDLEYHLPRTARPILLEYVEGHEYTIDVYTGLDGRPRCAVPRLRREVRSGEVVKASALRIGCIVDAAVRIAAALPGPRGVLTLQCRLPEGSQDPCFFEINPRFGGGVPLSIRIGADFPRWLIEEALGRTPVVDPDSFLWGASMLRYEDAVWLGPGGEKRP